MNQLRTAMFIGALVAFALGFILVLQGPVTSASGLFPSWGPSMMGRGMGPGMMGRGGPGPIGLVQAPVPETATPPNASNDLALPGTVLLVAGGAALLGWWWAGRPASLREKAQETPLEIARRRYVDGEITLLDFEQIVQGLLSSDTLGLEPSRRKG